MTDIVERLRITHAEGWNVEHPELWLEAAERIERLEAALAAVSVPYDIRAAKAEIERLRARISQLEQALSQAGDTIELQEAEQRGFERGRAFEQNESK